jgi:hypothetical protein
MSISCTTDIQKYKKYYKGLRYHIEHDHRNVFVCGNLFTGIDGIIYVNIYHANCKDVKYKIYILFELLFLLECSEFFILNKSDLRKRKLELIRNDR